MEDDETTSEFYSENSVSYEQTEVAAKPAYHIEGLFDHASPDGVWFYHAQGNDLAQVSDMSLASQLKDGDSIQLDCEDAGLIDVGTNSYSRRATQYTGCTLARLDKVEGGSNAELESSRNAKSDAELGSALADMAEDNGGIE